MNTGTAVTRNHGVAGTAASTPGFLNALRGELTYVRSNRAIWISLSIWAACVIVFAYLVSYLSTVGAAWYTPEQQALFVNAMLPGGTGYYVLASLPMYGAPQFAILGAILGASGYVSGTIRTVTARFPGRPPLMAARLAVLVLVAAAAAMFTLAASIVSSLGVAAASETSVEFPPLTDLAVAFAAIWLVAATFIALGFGIGTLVRRTLAATVIVLVWTLGIEMLLVGMLAPVFQPLADLQGYLPAGATASLAASLIPAGQQTMPAMIAATGPSVATVVLLGWLLAAGIVSMRVFQRRDLA